MIYTPRSHQLQSHEDALAQEMESELIPKNLPFDVSLRGISVRKEDLPAHSGWSFEHAVFTSYQRQLISHEDAIAQYIERALVPHPYVLYEELLRGKNVLEEAFHAGYEKGKPK